jgi:hypothetical protein
MFGAFPMILIAVVLYNLTVLGLMVGGQHDAAALLGQKFSIKMASGDMWTVTLSDIVLVLSLGLLFIETIKATRTTARAILNHALSMLTFAAALVEFILLKGFATSTFFLITAMCLFDVVAGYTISVVAARRDLVAAEAEHSR